MGKNSASGENYEKGYKAGHAEGSANKPCSAPSHLLDFINTKEQQAYEDGHRHGHKDGQANPNQKK